MNAPRLGAAFAFLVLVMAAIFFLYHFDDKPEIAIIPACAPLPNPCATMRCIPKTETGRLA